MKQGFNFWISFSLPSCYSYLVFYNTRRSRATLSLLDVQLNSEFCGLGRDGKYHSPLIIGALSCLIHKIGKPDV
jgi:hypothetical protein